MNKILVNALIMANRTVDAQSPIFYIIAQSNALGNSKLIISYKKRHREHAHGASAILI